MKSLHSIFKKIHNSGIIRMLAVFSLFFLLSGYLPDTGRLAARQADAPEAPIKTELPVQISLPPAAQEPPAPAELPTEPAPAQPRAPKTPRASAAPLVIPAPPEGTELTYISGILIVNKSYPVPTAYAPGTDPAAQAAFNEMADAAAAEGLKLYISSGFRSYEAQMRIHKSYISKYGQAASDAFSARPGYSEHQTGLAFDLNGVENSFADTAEGQWVAAHCHEYGFIIRYPDGKQEFTGYKYEPWHIRYLGVDTASAVYASGLCLEEYLGVTSVYDEPAAASAPPALSSGEAPASPAPAEAPAPESSAGIAGAEEAAPADPAACALSAEDAADTVPGTEAAAQTEAPVLDNETDKR